MSIGQFVWAIGLYWLQSTVVILIDYMAVYLDKALKHAGLHPPQAVKDMIQQTADSIVGVAISTIKIRLREATNDFKLRDSLYAHVKQHMNTVTTQWTSMVQDSLDGQTSYRPESQVWNVRSNKSELSWIHQVYGCMAVWPCNDLRNPERSQRFKDTFN
ncbi:hypothetical protein F5Y01DRAFT_328356 [Xylaria sp. FL0043]|nr:hypothetical protein F5Y01DRAFT_328356 [Xylaria sp. FL0043]